MYHFENTQQLINRFPRIPITSLLSARYRSPTYNAAKYVRTTKANNGGGIQKMKTKEVNPKHSLTQGKLRSAQGHQLKVLERLLVSMGWRGQRTNSGSNGRSSGLLHNKFDIQECVIRKVSLLNHLVKILFRPEAIARLSSNLELWEPKSCSENNDMSREEVYQPLGLQRNSPHDECLRRDTMLDMMAPEFGPLVERRVAEHLQFHI